MTLSLSRQKIIVVIIILGLTIFQLGRMFAFINVYGGIEHDGGWMLSISRSLAEQGTYTTMVSTLIDPNVLGGIGVDEKFDIQAPDGRIWFFTGNGIGPSSIVPDALVLKIFGTGFWSLHLGPLIFYTLFLLLAALTLYRLAGLGAVVLFNAFLFFYPHISIFLGYEAMGEVPTMFYILGTYLAFAWVLKKQTQRWWRFLLVGLVIGVALNAKLIALWSLSAIFMWAGFLWMKSIIQRKQSNESGKIPAKFRSIHWLALAGGALIPPVLWELLQLLVLTRIAGFDLYLRHADQRLKFILDDGSGVGLRLHSGAEFFWDKFFLLSEIAHPQRWVTTILFLAIFGGGLALLWLWQRELNKQNLLAPLWLGWLANTLWFTGLAKTGWARHFWFGLVLAAMLLCVITVVLIKYGLGKPDLPAFIKTKSLKNVPLSAGLILLLLLGWGFVSQPYVWGFTIPDEIVPYWQGKQINNKYHASLPWIIIPRASQSEIVEYIKQMPAEANVYYPGQHKAAEIPPQTGRIQYPFNRYCFMTPHPADIVLISPSIISPWKDPIQRQDLLNLVERECAHPAVKNDFYMVCPIKDNPPQ